MCERERKKKKVHKKKKASERKRAGVGGEGVFYECRSEMSQVLRDVRKKKTNL